MRSFARKNVSFFAPNLTGYYSALQIHSLITQPSVTEIIVSDIQIKPSEIEIQGVRFQFIYHNKHRLFGIENTW